MMIISINTCNICDNRAFMSRKPNFSNEELTKILTPMMEARLSVNEMMKQSGLPRKLIYNWFLVAFGKTPGKVYREQQHQKICAEIAEYKKQGKTNEEIAGIIGRTKIWVSEIVKCLEFPGIAKNIHYRAEKLLNKERSMFKELLTEFFSLGGTISEAAKKFNKPVSRIYYWMQVFNIKSEKQLAYQKMQERVPELLKSGMKIKEMSKELGISRLIISKYIKELTGQDYRSYKAGRRQIL